MVVSAPEGIRTPNLLIRSQPRAVRAGLSLSVECSGQTLNTGSILRRQSNVVRCRLTPFNGVWTATFGWVVTSP
jgi:hypothetical protein